MWINNNYTLYNAKKKKSSEWTRNVIILCANVKFYNYFRKCLEKPEKCILKSGIFDRIIERNFVIE